MRFRLGLMVGFGSGYYLGAKAGQERYLQLKRWVDKAAERAKDAELVGTAADKARAVVDLGVERAKDLIDRGGPDHEVGANGNGFSR